MRKYELQAKAVKIQLDRIKQLDTELGLKSTETIICLSDAIDSIERADKLEDVAREIINLVFENKCIFDDEAKELSDKLQKILGEWEPGDPDMNGPNQAERDEMHYNESKLK